MSRLKRLLGKTLSAVALIGVAAVGVAAVFTIGSVISRKGKAGAPGPESPSRDTNQTDTDPPFDSTQSWASINQRNGPAS